MAGGGGGGGAVCCGIASGISIGAEPAIGWFIELIRRRNAAVFASPAGIITDMCLLAFTCWFCALNSARFAACLVTAALAAVWIGAEPAIG